MTRAPETAQRSGHGAVDAPRARISLSAACSADLAATTRCLSWAVNS